MSKKVNIKKRNSIKKYIGGVTGFLVAMLFFKSEAKAAIFNSKTADSHKLQIDGSDALSIDAQKNVTFGAGLKDANVTTAVTLGDANNTEFNTTSQSIVGATNEVYDHTFPIPKLEMFCDSGTIYCKWNQLDTRFLDYKPFIFLLKRRLKTRAKKVNTSLPTYPQGKRRVQVKKGFHMSSKGEKVSGTYTPTESVFHEEDGHDDSTSGVARTVVFPLGNNNGTISIMNKTDIAKRFSDYSADPQKSATGRSSGHKKNQYFKFAIGIVVPNGSNHKLYLGPLSETVKSGYQGHYSQSTGMKIWELKTHMI